MNRGDWPVGVVWDGPDSAAAEDAIDGGLTHSPPPRPEEANGAADWVHRPAAGLEQQRLEQSWKDDGKSKKVTTLFKLGSENNSEKGDGREIRGDEPGRREEGTEERKERRPARPKNLATKAVALA